MRRAEYDADRCSLAAALAIIGDRWSVLVLREAFFGVRRFDQLQRNLGIARNILTGRLHAMVEAGILARRPYQERPLRHEYVLTERGIDLYPILIALMQWGDRHLAGEAGGPVVLRHRPCGEISTPTLTCSACGEPIDPREMEAEAPPAPATRAGAPTPVPA